MNCNDKIIQRCDKVMVVCFYATIFFLPISTAIIETLFGIIIFSYIFKRERLFYQSIEDINRHNKGEIWKVWQKFLQVFKPVNTNLNKSIGLYVFICFMSIFYSHYPYLSLKAFIFKLLQDVFTCLLFVECINSVVRFRNFFIIYLASFSLISLSGISQYFFKYEFIHHHLIIDGRVTSSFRHANDFGGYLLIGVPVLINLCLLALRQRKIFSSLSFFKNNILKIILFISMILSIMCLAFTFSRGVWLGFCFSLFLLFRYRKTNIQGVFILLIGILFFSIFPPLMEHNRNVSFFTDDVKSLKIQENKYSKEKGLQRMIHIASTIISQLQYFGGQDRKIYWQEAIRIIKHYPILGTGLNTYSMVAPKYKISWGGYPHNCYLQMTAELGIVGLMVFLRICYNIFHYAGEVFKKNNCELDNTLLSGFLAGLLGYLVHSFFDTNFYSVQLDILMWLTIGIIINISKRSNTDWECLDKT